MKYTRTILIIPIFLLFLMGCDKDEPTAETEVVCDLGGTWEIPGLGSFLINHQMANSTNSITTVTIDLEDTICGIADFQQVFIEFANQTVKENKIEHAQSGDQVDFQGFFDEWDLRRIDFSCNFPSCSAGEGVMIISVRNSFGSNWCDQTFNFTAEKK